MVHVRFDPSSASFPNYHQIGFGSDYNYFKGLPPYQIGFGYQQRGAGLGDILKGIWRFLLPVIKSPAAREIGQTLGKEAISSGSKILTRVIEGDPLKTAALEEGRSAAESLLEKGIEKVRRRSKQTGSGFGPRTVASFGDKYINRSKNKRQHILSRTVIKPKSINRKKKRRIDAFGFY